MTYRGAIAKVGTWLYGGTVETPVDVIALDFDWGYQFAESEGQLTPGEEPTPLGPDGYLYYVRFQTALTEPLPAWPDSIGFPTLEEAMLCAEGKVKGGVRWNDN